MTKANITLGFAVVIAIGIVLCLEGCFNSMSQQHRADKGESVLTIGLAFPDAERILDKHGARKTLLDVAPPQSANGGDMKVDCYSLPGNRAICITHDVIRGRDKIVDIEVFHDMDKPKSQRKTERLKEIDIRSR